VRTLPPDTGPPVINASAVGSYPHGTKGDDFNPVSATKNARLGLVSQVRGTRVPLVRLDSAIAPEDWLRLRWLATDMRSP
jgi:hypothetical protein